MTTLTIKEYIKIVLKKYIDLRNNYYDRLISYCLENRFFSKIVKVIHISLIQFRFLSLKFINSIEKYVTFSTFILILSIIFSRLNMGGPLILFYFLLLRLDSGVVSISRFYQRNPSKMKHIQPYFSKRNMWSKVGKVVEEAAHNPQVQAVVVGMGTLTVYKAVDLWDTYKQVEIAEQDRDTAERTANKDRAAENQRHDEEMATRRRELDEAKASREQDMEKHRQEISIRERELDEAKASREQVERHHRDEMAMRQRELEATSFKEKEINSTNHEHTKSTN